MPSADVSVILVNWQSLGSLPRCLQSLHEQSVHPARILLVDNSGDRGCFGLKRDFPALEIVPAGRNLGFAAANNLGLASCETRFVALLNPDAFAEPEWLERLLAAAESHPQCAAFGSVQLLDEAPEILDGIGDSYHPSGIFRREGHGRRCSEYGDLQPRDIFSPCAAAALYRRDALQAVGGFDEDFFCYGEDVDLGFRLRLAGWKAMLVPEAMVRHVGSASSGGQRSDFASYHGHRNMVWVYVKNMPGFLFWLFLPLHMLANLASMLFLTIRGQGKIAWRAKRDAIRGLPIMWKKRQATQSKRVASIKNIWCALFWRL